MLTNLSTRFFILFLVFTLGAILKLIFKTNSPLIKTKTRNAITNSKIKMLVVILSKN